MFPQISMCLKISSISFLFALPFVHVAAKASKISFKQTQKTG